MALNAQTHGGYLGLDCYVGSAPNCNEPVRVGFASAVGAAASCDLCGVTTEDATASGRAVTNIETDAVYSLNVIPIDSAGAATTIEVGGKVYIQGSGASGFSLTANSTANTCIFGTFLGVDDGSNAPVATSITASALSSVVMRSATI